MPDRLRSLLGIAVFLGVAWLISYKRKNMPWRTIGWGVGLHIALTAFMIKSPAGVWFFAQLGRGVNRVLDFSQEGSKFLFGTYATSTFTFALNVLPTIVFICSLMALLNYFGVVQYIVRGLAWGLRRTLGTSGPETLSNVATIFMGQVEGSFMVRPYLKDMTRSELLCIMLGGFATVSGSVLAAYVGMLNRHFPGIGSHLITASIINAVIGLVIAKIILPETEKDPALTTMAISREQKDVNAVGALTKGALDGMHIALSVGAMFVALIALVAMANAVIGFFVDGWTLQRLLSYVFWPAAYVMGVPLKDCFVVAELLGQRMALNEFVAYVRLSDMIGAHQISPRASLLATYALCGFANFGSIGVQIGGLTTIVPERRTDFAQLAFRAMLGGTLASFISACVAGLILG